MKPVSRRLLPLAAILAFGTALGGCNTLTRLSQVGEEPPLTSIQNPIAMPTYQPVSMPMPAPVTEERQANSLWRTGSRSEEHTSELQSLMRISYAVFCLKKKKKTN